MSDSPSVRCPRCGAAVSGKFCASCGMSLAERTCSGCGMLMAAGARFCPQCGALEGQSVGQSPPMTQGAGTIAPWLTPWRIVEVLAVVAGLAVIWAATRAGRPGAAPTSGTADVPTASAPDISNLPPREQFGRLADRVETAMENGDTATVVKFYPMVESSFVGLTASDRDIDARFHISVLRARIGHFPAGLAQADTIAATAPSHLFVYYLKAIINDFQHDTAAAGRARRDFRKHFAAEIATNRPEYVAHRQMLDQFLATIPVGGKP